MPAQVTTRAQVNGYRFLIRRLQHALIRSDSRMIHDPMRGQMRAMLVGVVIAVLITGAAGVLAFFKPAPNFGSSSIMFSKSTGTLFVRMGDRLHPVLNLASARLITGKNDPPQEVDDKFLNTVPLGPIMGIIGAPSGIRGTDDTAMSDWTVCDSTQLPATTTQFGTTTVRTTVLANDPLLGDGIRASMADEAILARAGDTTFLIYDGVRAEVDPADPALKNVLRLDGAEIRDLSPGLLNAFPLVAPLRSISIPGAGEPTTYLDSADPVGSILGAVDSRGTQLYVVLRAGLQPISAATADVIRYGNAQLPAASGAREVSPALVGAAPRADDLPVDRYPTAPPRFVRTDLDQVVCMSYRRNEGSGDTTTRLLVGHRLPIPDGAGPVPLATADGAGPSVDGVYLRPGSGEFVRASGGGSGPAMGQSFYVNDLGLRFPIADAATATALGVVGRRETGGDRPVQGPVPQTAPWAVLSLLPPGPELSQRAALIAHDGMSADPVGLAITPPRG